MTKIFAAARHNWAQNREEGNALVFALLVLFVCVTTAAVVAAIALTSSQTSKNLNYTVAYQSATDSALANALLFANSPSPNGGFAGLNSHRGVSGQVTGQLPAASSKFTVKWRWYTDRVASSGGQASNWYIYADAYTGSPTDANARHVRMTISPLVTTQASYASANNRITYTGDVGSAFQYGLLGVNGVALANNTHVYSYDSQTSQNPTGTGSGNAQVATNSQLALGTGTAVNIFNRFAGATCTPAANCPPTTQITDTQYGYNFNLDGITNTVSTACPNAASTYPSWTASTSGALLNGSCYNTLDFDANYPAANAVKVYVKGNVTVRAGVQVYYNGAPNSLQIYSQAGSTAQFANGSAASPTVFNGLVAGATLTCADSGAAAANSLILHGSLACSNLNFNSGTTLWLDDAARNATPSSSANTVYNVLNYQVSSKVQ